IDDSGRQLLPYLPRLAGAAGQLSFDQVPRVVRLGSLTQYHYPQRVGGREVENADYIVQVDEKSGPYEIFLNTVHNATVSDVAASPQDAVAVVSTLVNKGAHERSDFTGQRDNLQISITPLDANPHYLAVDRQLYNVYEIEARVSVLQADGHETLLMLRIYSVDASRMPNDASSVVRLRNLIHYSTTGKAPVFRANPVTLLSALGTISGIGPAPTF